MATGYRSTTNYRASIPYRGVTSGGGTASWTGTIVSVVVSGFAAIASSVAAWTPPAAVAVSVSGFSAVGGGSATASWTGTTVTIGVSGFGAGLESSASWTGTTVVVASSGFGATSDAFASWSGSTVTVTSSGFAYRRPETVNLWTRARRMLDHGLEVLQFELPTPFTVDHLAGVQFIGSIEESNYGNNLGAGGFIPEATATLYIRRAVFRAQNLTPWPGMKLRVQVTTPDGVISNRSFVVTDVGVNEHRWRLTLVQGQPKPSDVPDRNLVPTPY